jgi:hypothetical protein
MAIRRVTEVEIRGEFNRSGLFERAERGEVLKTTIRDAEPDPSYHQPPGTRSQTIEYHDVVDGRLVKVAVVHQFLLPNGRINNRAERPDPKYLLVDGEIWALHRS